MFIRTIDEGLARMLRALVPLPEDAVDFSYAVPSTSWAAQLSRPTLSLFLYEIKPSSRPAQSAVRRVDADGRVLRRAPTAVLELNYLVSAWADDPLAEHQLLGEVVNQIVGYPVLPLEYLPGEPTSKIYMIFSGDDKNQLRDIWQAAGGQMKASFTLSVVAAADSFPWTEEAPPVIEVLRGISRRGG